jgi:hypothetical protein
MGNELVDKIEEVATLEEIGDSHPAKLFMIGEKENIYYCSIKDCNCTLNKCLYDSCPYLLKVDISTTKSL